jgi:hypothetical protein
VRVRIDYAIRSKIEIEAGSWAPVAFEREGTHFQIEKPVPKREIYHAFEGPSKVWALIEISLVSIEAESPDSASEDDWPLLWQRIGAIRNELVAWIRALTRQYWFGHRELQIVSEPIKVTGLAGDRDISGEGSSGSGFKYGRTLVASDWEVVGDGLAQDRRAPLHLSLFCDGLLDIAEGDMTQAAFMLGVSCEVGVYLAVRRLLEARCQPLLNMLDNKYLQYRFDALLDLPSQLGVPSFSTFDKEAACRVNELHESRNAALHRGKCVINRKGCKIAFDRENVNEYLDAVEKLFSWCDSI